jgi:hypothetical protein
VRLGEGIKPRPKNVLSGWEEARRVTHRDKLQKMGTPILQCVVFWVVAFRHKPYPHWLFLGFMGLFTLLVVAYTIGSAYAYWKEYIRGKQA